MGFASLEEAIDFELSTEDSWESVLRTKTMLNKLITILVDKRVLNAQDVSELLGNGYEVSDE